MLTRGALVNAMSDYAQAYAYIAALTGQAPEQARVSFRAIHDTRQDVPAYSYDGTLPELWNTLCSYQQHGYGIFVNINELDGNGRELHNVRSIRAQCVDLDKLDATQQAEAATAWTPAPSFGVNSSPGKFHIYWLVNPYAGNDFYNTLQRKLRQLFNGDKNVIDPTRVLRLPGTFNLKRDVPHLVTCWGISNARYDVAALASATQHVNVIEGNGGRHELGDPSLAAPSIEWVQKALDLIDPNLLDRGEWIAVTAGIKQCAWSLADPDAIYTMWTAWCARYEANDVAENHKQWNSIRNSELGWQSLRRRVPALMAITLFGAPQAVEPIVQPGPVGNTPIVGSPVPPMPEPQQQHSYPSEYLDIFEQQEYFKDCVYVVNLGEILAPNGRFLDASQFNASYGGKKFVLGSDGKVTDEAWKAATRCTLWQLPKVDHIRFLPDTPYRTVITDDLGRPGVNVYKPAIIKTMEGDVSPFLWHIAALLPNVVDQRILIDYLAHNVKYPGHKIPWAPVIQSTEGAGKGVIKLIMRNAIGRSYTYYPKASELAESGAKFNAWLRNRLFILVDEIRVDERRELIEVLKPLISEEETEIQAKGVDQAIEDNFSNWCFFTNWKDAVPITKRSRRFAVMYSPLQSVQDLLDRQMGDQYFTRLYEWLKADGAAIVTNYLMQYPIERGSLPGRAPDTSSTAEAIEMSRSPIERAILEAVGEGVQGFRGGWVSVTSAIKRIKSLGITARSVTPQTVQTVLETMGYVSCGRAHRPYFAEDREIRPILYHWAGPGDVQAFGPLQGWE